MNTRTTAVLVLTAGVPLLFGSAKAGAQEVSRPQLQAVRVQAPPAIDGVLDDEAWRGEPQASGAWLSYNPLHGQAIPQHTKAWIAFDDKYLYFAFQCDDQEPSAVKTSITRGLGRRHLLRRDGAIQGMVKVHVLRRIMAAHGETEPVSRLSVRGLPPC